MKRIKIREGSPAWWLVVAIGTALSLWEMYWLYIYLYCTTI